MCAKTRFDFLAIAFGCFIATIPLAVLAQPEDKKDDKKFGFGKGPGFGQTRKLVKDFDKDGDGRLNAEERKAARETAKKDRKGFGSGFGPGGSPTGFIAKALLETLDTDKDGKLAHAEVVAGLKTFLDDLDKDKKDTIDEARLTEALNRILPRPKGFGPFPPPKADDGPKGKGDDGPPKFIGFSPGGPVARAILDRADADKSGKLAGKEAIAAAETLFKEADKDKDGKLDEMELVAGLNPLFPAPGKGGFGKGPFGKSMPPAKPGPRVNPADVKNYPDAPFYQPTVLRTIFIDFDDKDWEAELADFYKTDVEVPATLTVDGKKYPNVGVHFRGMSSFMGVPVGYKRSLNLSIDFADRKQRLYGQKTVNLLNSHDDPSFLSTVLFSHIARQHVPAPKANLVKVVINGESWGVYVNAQQFNKEFAAEHFPGGKAARWKVQGSPGGSGGLEYSGDDIADYKRRFQIKSDDRDQDWKDLINLCRVLHKTPADKLEEEITPILDVDGALWFIALDITLANMDGYWTRASDYSICRDGKGKFHIIPHDMNEAFGVGFAPGFGGFGGKGPGKEFGKDDKDGPKDKEPGKKDGKGMGFGGKGRSAELDPLAGLKDDRKPLRSKLLAVPKFRAKYLDYVRQIADDLEWAKLGPVVAQYRGLIEKEIEIDTRKLSSLEEFLRATADTAPKEAGRGSGIRSFADARRAYLLSHPAIKKGE